MKKKYKFLQKHKSELITTFQNLEGNKWSLNFPVFIFNRSWFKLKKVTLYNLCLELKPDNSQEAPELIYYQDLLNQGIEPLIAIQRCWHEFGIEDFHRSLRNTSEWETKGNNGWTFKKYSDLIIRYRENIDSTEIHIPLIILGRNSKENHQLEWFSKESIGNLTFE